MRPVAEGPTDPPLLLSIRLGSEESDRRLGGPPTGPLRERQR
jgi:hypothetical protein